MKHLQTFESFVDNINEAAKFAVGDLVRYSQPSSGMSALYGVVVKSYGWGLDMAIVGKSSHKDMKPTETYMKMQFVPSWKGAGMSADELEKKSGGSIKELKNRFITSWENS